MLRTKGGTKHVKKSEVKHIQKQLEDGQKEGAAFRAVVACQKVKQIVKRERKLIEEVEQAYDAFLKE